MAKGDKFEHGDIVYDLLNGDRLIIHEIAQIVPGYDWYRCRTIKSGEYTFIFLHDFELSRKPIKNLLGFKNN